MAMSGFSSNSEFTKRDRLNDLFSAPPNQFGTMTQKQTTTRSNQSDITYLPNTVSQPASALRQTISARVKATILIVRWCIMWRVYTTNHHSGPNGLRCSPSIARKSKTQSNDRIRRAAGEEFKQSRISLVGKDDVPRAVNDVSARGSWNSKLPSLLFPARAPGSQYFRFAFRLYPCAHFQLSAGGLLSKPFERGPGGVRE